MQGEAEREVVRVTVECCLQERSWNPYYVHLLQRLLAASKAHRITLQYCLWDQFKQAEQADMRRLINLAHLTGQLIATFALSSSILKVSCCSQVANTPRPLPAPFSSLCKCVYFCARRLYCSSPPAVIVLAGSTYGACQV